MPDGPQRAPSGTVTMTGEEYDSLRLEAERLRALLWGNHGHDGLYGDDGEMQCNLAGSCCDFRRDSLEQIGAHMLPPMTAQYAPSGEPGPGEVDLLRGLLDGTTRAANALRAELADYKAGSDEEARAGDKARRQLAAWRAAFAAQCHAADALRVELAQVHDLRRSEEHRWQQLLKAAFAQRDQYLTELQQARAVVSAARDLEAIDHGVAWPDPAHAVHVLDHSPAVGEPGHDQRTGTQDEAEGA